ncbi:MAG: GNAT family N-acetyltransferase [Agathobacter sp.]|nr:GNAT family N-acetyltransferase [Agathobacter sp.]
MEIRFIENIEEKEIISHAILTQLPEWFGLPNSTKEYIQNSKTMPFWACFDENKLVGFVALKKTSKSTAEIYVMGVLKEYHRMGIGRLLYEAFEQYAKEQGYEFVQVKTVKKGHYKEYDITNAFYEKLGFKELECFPTLWDEWNPCQIYVKYIGDNV